MATIYKRKLLNFRCPRELLAAIDAVGRVRHPVDTDSGCDRSKTLLDIIQAGIIALGGSEEAEIVRQFQLESKTDDLQGLIKAEVSKALQQSSKDYIDDALKNSTAYITNGMNDLLKEVHSEIAALKAQQDELAKKAPARQTIREHLPS